MVLAASLAFAVMSQNMGVTLNWETNYEAALAKAKKLNRPVLANFTGSDWCGWCHKLRDEVFLTFKFKDWSDKRVVLLELDYPKQKKLSPELIEQNDKLLSSYEVASYPTILFLNAEGDVIGKSGYMREPGPYAWTKDADGQIAPWYAQKS